MDTSTPTSLRRTLEDWHRGYPEKRIAGVCCAVAAQLGVPLPLVRAGFLVLAIVPSFGAAVALYLALWFVTPAQPGERSGLERVIAWIEDFAMGVHERPRGAAGDAERREE
jgi:phage shock protein PspC (stress-responsive transcriptional regulator)